LKYKSRHDLEQYLRGKHLGKGDKVEILSSNSDQFSSSAAVILVLVAIVYVFGVLEKKIFVDGILDELFKKEHLDTFERQIEQEFGIDIKVTQDVSVEMEDREFWNALGSQSFQKAYGEDEPDYADVWVIEPNPK